MLVESIISSSCSLMINHVCRAVTMEEGQQLAKNLNATYIETCAKTHPVLLLYHVLSSAMHVAIDKTALITCCAV
jgi:hypothetical protein